MRRLAVLALTATLAMGNFAFTDAGGDRVYFTCQSTTPNSNAELVNGSWSTDEPTGAMMSGSGGCFSFDSPMTGTSNDNPLYDTSFTGNVDAPVTDLALHLFAGSAASSATYGVLISSGETVLYDGSAGVTFTEGDGGPFPQTRELEATITGLKIKKGLLTVKLFALNDAAFILYGSSDAPAGLTFNPDEIAGTEIAA